MKDELMHLGTPHEGSIPHSGRWPFGSGDNPYQHAQSHKATVLRMRKQGLSNGEIAELAGMGVRELIRSVSTATQFVNQENHRVAQELKLQGLNNREIGEHMGVPESTVRGYLDPVATARSEVQRNTAEFLRDRLDESPAIDIGYGSERWLGISRTKLMSSAQLLIEEGYKLQYFDVEQLGTGKETSVMALVRPDTDWTEINKDKTQIASITDFHTEDGGLNYYGLETPKSIDSSRVYIRYDEQGGTLMDGTIEFRAGCEDLNLGNARYAQVRVAVDDKYYLKGVAFESDHVPEGYDVVFNTNKAEGTPMEKVFKPLKDDPDNPFGAVVRQSHDPITGELSPVNIVRQEGEWDEWSKSLAAQVLSKQSPVLAQHQLDIKAANMQAEFEEIMGLTNPVVKQNLLMDLARTCDASAGNLKAAAMPGQATKLLLPAPTLKDNEVYDPTLPEGTVVCLIRFPHGGIFEIPELTVTHHNAQANEFGPMRDAIAVNHNVLSQLSGADCDGDTVVRVPQPADPALRLKHKAYLQELVGFEPKMYKTEVVGKDDKGHDVYRVEVSDRQKQQLMGSATNLIADMTALGAPDDKIARAVKYSMVVIDAQKHHLDYKQAYEDFEIADLKREYQGGANRGAGTLMTRAGSQARIPVYKERTDPETGAITREIDTKRQWTDKEGNVHTPMVKTDKMSITTDAYTLTSGGSRENPGTQIEAVYAEYANRMKAMANECRKQAMGVELTQYSSTAAKAYAEEVKSLKQKVATAEMNAPRERQAQIWANEVVRNKREADPDLTDEELKRIKGQALTAARTRIGASKEKVTITPKEWEAISKGAVSNSVLRTVLLNTDSATVREYAMPRSNLLMSPAKISRAKALMKAGYQPADIAAQLGVSTSTMFRAINGEGAYAQ